MPNFGKDMVLNYMSGSVVISAIDRTDGLYQILMHTSDIPLTAVSTSSDMLWEVASNDTTYAECTGYFQSYGVSGAETTSGLRAQLLR